MMDLGTMKMLRLRIKIEMKPKRVRVVDSLLGRVETGSHLLESVRIMKISFLIWRVSVVGKIIPTMYWRAMRIAGKSRSP